MKNSFDLRVVIGLFFGIVGIILLITSMTMSTGVEKSEATNFWGGIVYIVFSAIMLLLWRAGSKKDHDLNEPNEDY